ncbi:SacI homology domain-containing protein [Mrakia frigida]|uniref:SacI homology domain-containing protein n=1 Tax=Mrakia frigida TaxID=29902 RepID=UPI003FCC270D
MSRSKSDQSLHQTLNLYISPDAYVFEPVATSPLDEKGHQKEKETMVIDRVTGAISLNPPGRLSPVAHEDVITVYGILGIVSLVTTDYLILITHKSPSSRFLGHDISLATSFRLLPLSSSTPSSSNLPPLETHLLKLVSLGLNSGQIWFSYTWDLTNTLERQWRQDKARGGRLEKGSAAERADDRFFWNKALMRRFLEVGRGVVGGVQRDEDLSRFILPVMYGSFELRQTTISSRPFLFALISRRSRYRAGTRFFTRGLDHDGNAANYVETEQIVLLDRLPSDASDDKTNPPSLGAGVEGRERFSFVQIRGSAPIFWAQVNNLRYTPDLQIMDLPETTSALRSHLSEQIAIYGSLYLVNLVNQVKYERPVKEAFENAMIVVDEPKAKYIYFDFHKECKGMRFDRVQGLVEKLREGLDEEGYFHLSGPVDSEGSSLVQPRKMQASVIRTNCMDSLDRTNVVQSALAKFVIDKQLRSAGILAPNDTVENHPDFMSVFRNVWADHADSVSNAYSGTGALKTDATRTGKRTKQGVLKDGWNSVVRYLKNNYRDGSRQDALDLLTGAWVIRRGVSAPLLDSRPLIMRLMPYILLLSLAINSASVQYSFWTSDHPLSISWPVTFQSLESLPSFNYTLLGFWTLIALFSAVYIWANGINYVSWPRLNPPLEVLNYDGPGFRTTQHGRGFHLKKPRWGKGRAAQVLKGGVDVVQGGLGAVAVGVGAVGGGGGVGDAGLDRRKGRHERLD